MLENGEFRQSVTSTTKALTGVDTSGWLLAPFLLENLTQGENAPVAENALVAQEKSTMEGDDTPFLLPVSCPGMPGAASFATR